MTPKSSTTPKSTGIGDADDASERWVVEAGRELDPPHADVARLTTTVIESARRLSHSRTELATDVPSVLVTDRVVRRVILTEVRRALGRSVLEVSVDSDQGEVVSVRLGLMCRFDDVLSELAQDAREVVAGALGATLGSRRGASAAQRVDVDWMDLEWTDPGKN